MKTGNRGVLITAFVLIFIFAAACISAFFILKDSGGDKKALVYSDGKLIREINLDEVKFKGYAFQIEMKYTSLVLGFKIKEVSVIFVNRQLGTSKMNTSIFGEAFFGVIDLRLRKMRGNIKPKVNKLIIIMKAVLP